MSLRLRAASAAAFLLCVLSTLPAGAAEFTDSAGRIVQLPAHVGRVLAADPAGAVLVYVLAPDKLAAWPRRPIGSLPARHARLPAVGPLTPAAVARLHPDLIIDCGPVTPPRVAFADGISQATGVPYLLLDNSFARTPTMLRVIGRVLGVAERADDLASSAEHAINTLRGRLLIQPATERPRVYYAGGPSGLIPAVPGSGAAASIEAAGAINVATAPGAGAPAVVTPQQVRDWNPDIIIAQDRSFYVRALRSRTWAGLAAVRNHKLLLEPSSPFGWINDPAGVNRLIGLYWLSVIFYPGDTQYDLRSLMADFYDKFYGIKLTDAQIEAVAKTAGIPPSETPHLSALPGLNAPGGPNPGAPGSVNEPGRRGVLPNAAPPETTTPSDMLPK